LSLFFSRRAAQAFCFLVVLSSCQTPPAPSEVERVKIQEHELWRAGAPVYAADEYSRYLQYLRLARDNLIKEKAKLRWFRDYQGVRSDFLVVLTQGDRILEKVRKEKQTQSRDLSQRLAKLGERVSQIKTLTLTMNENAPVRQNLAQAEVVFAEAKLLFNKEKFQELDPKFEAIENHLQQAEEALFSILARYADEVQVAKWRKWANETIAESRRKGSAAILVSKLDRTLTLYKKGKPVAVYEIGLGKCGLSDKLCAGDEATPEGRYKIIKKIPQGSFYKALLIDYPNDEDRKQFSSAKKKGLVPPGAGIGGLIEIHGGGNDSLTNGCVAVQNEVMDRLYPAVAVGTPVTIIGSLESADKLLGSLRKS
jgi:hypothetical protein